ncbi:MAG TPA: CPBP family intramembrane glutamic endopeptidase [Phycisphaerae bacterium]|nr:CPBP family intramembrane glutamic endopeptidase [Phycisphaerae bacterium]
MVIAIQGDNGLPARRRKLDSWTWFALFFALVAYPAAYCAGYVGPLIHEIFRGSRAHWWYFWLLVLAFHWVPLGFVWLALKKNREPWSSIGVDWRWYRRWWWVFATILAALIAAAFVAPGLHYPDGLPRIGRSKPQFMIPLSTPERLFVIFVAFTAGVTEEVLFRGFAITRLTRIVGSPWRALPITVVSFLFIHGTPRSVQMCVVYAFAGLAFGVPFILMKQRRLEVLILIHFLIDAGMVLAD